MTPEDRASLLQDRIHEDTGAVRVGRTARCCTCHPDDMTPPCERKYALGDCRISRLERERDALREALRSAVTLLRDVMQRHRDTDSDGYNECDKPEEKCLWCVEGEKVCALLGQTP